MRGRTLGAGGAVGRQGPAASLAFLAALALASGAAFGAAPPATRASASFARAGDEKASLDVEAALAVELRDRDPQKRRRAVGKLAQLGTREAWRLVLSALWDGESGVADEAQLRVGELADPELVDELFGNDGLASKNANVRARVAEALGRLRFEVDGDSLARELSSRDPELRRALLWSIERLAREQRIGRKRERAEQAVLHVLRAETDPELRGVALFALAALDPTSVEPLARRSIAERDAALRCAALEVALLARCPAAQEWCVDLADDPDASVRLQAVEGLERLGTRAGLLALANRLDLEERLRLRWRIFGALQRLTGMRFALDGAAWKEWIATLDDTWRPVREPAPERTPAARDAPGVAASTGGLAGMPIFSDRVAFLFDFSGSMWTAMKDGRVPKDVVDEKLRAALAVLPAETEFNLVPFTYGPLPWQERIVPATPTNVRKALAFFEGCTARGRGNFYDAALLALSDPRVDTILVLTDGEPTGGLHSSMDLILPLYCERNRFRKVAIDSILVDAPARARRSWAELSARTGGRSIVVAL